MTDTKHCDTCGVEIPPIFDAEHVEFNGYLNGSFFFKDFCCLSCLDTFRERMKSEVKE